MTILTPGQLQKWQADGYLVIPDFYNTAETGELLKRARELLDDFDPTRHPLVSIVNSSRRKLAMKARCRSGLTKN